MRIEKKFSRCQETGKLMFPNELSGRASLLRLEAKTKNQHQQKLKGRFRTPHGKELNVYRCCHCNAFHVGHQWRKT
jgi:rubrerythrin